MLSASFVFQDHDDSERENEGYLRHDRVVCMEKWQFLVVSEILQSEGV